MQGSKLVEIETQQENSFLKGILEAGKKYLKIFLFDEKFLRILVLIIPKQNASKMIAFHNKDSNTIKNKCAFCLF